MADALSPVNHRGLHRATVDEKDLSKKIAIIIEGPDMIDLRANFGGERHGEISSSAFKAP